MRASNEWANRPDDQRFLTLHDLEMATGKRKAQSHSVVCDTDQAVILGDDVHYMVQAVLVDRDQEQHVIQPTNWGFNQLCQLAGAPPSYMRTLPPSFLANNLNWGFHQPVNRAVFSPLLRKVGGKEDMLRAITSPSYGRIWDVDVVRAIEALNQDDRWQVPHASYASSDPLQATTLYASDRDIFIFLVDPSNAVEVDGKSYYRGFFTWNSEVGDKTFGLCTFLYSYVCDNRIIWGATNIKELRIRHNSLAPERFASEFSHALQEYSQEGTKLLTAGIKAAKEKELKQAKNDETLVDWLRKQGLTKEQAEGSIKKAEVEEGQVASLWDIIQGITAYARNIQWADQRVELEEKAGQLMKLVV